MHIGVIFVWFFWRGVNVLSNLSKNPVRENAWKSIVWEKCFAVAPNNAPFVLN